MQQDNQTTQSGNNVAADGAGFTDDTQVMRYLLHNIKGISPVSGGEMEDALVPEYIPLDSADEDTVS